MKTGPITKLEKRNKTASKNSDNDVMSKNCDVTVIFGFLANLEQSGGRIPDTESSKGMFSVTVAFCLTKTKNITRKSLT